MPRRLRRAWGSVGAGRRPRPLPGVDGACRRIRRGRPVCRPVSGFRAEVCPGGHIGPPLHGVEGIPNQRKIGAKTDLANGAGQSPPPTGATEQGGLRQGAPGVWLPPAKFRNGIWGVSHGHPALRKQRWWCAVKGRCRHRPLRGEGEVPSTTQASGAQRSVCGANGRNGRESQQRSSPKCPATPDKPSVTAFGRASSLYTREPFGDGGCGLPRWPCGPPRNDIRFLSFRGAERRGNPSFLRWTMDGGSGRPTKDEGRHAGSSCPTGGCGEPPRLPWPAAHSGASAPAGAREGWESTQGPSQKGDRRRDRPGSA